MRRTCHNTGILLGGNRNGFFGRKNCKRWYRQPRQCSESGQLSEPSDGYRTDGRNRSGVQAQRWTQDHLSSAGCGIGKRLLRKHSPVRFLRCILFFSIQAEYLSARKHHSVRAAAISRLFDDDRLKLPNYDDPNVGQPGSGATSFDLRVMRGFRVSLAFLNSLKCGELVQIFGSFTGNSEQFPYSSTIVDTPVCTYFYSVLEKVLERN